MSSHLSVAYMQPNLCWFLQYNVSLQCSTLPDILQTLRFCTWMKMYLDLFKRDFKAKGLVVVRVEGVLLDCRLLLLQPLAVLHQVDLHVWICKEKGTVFTFMTKM